jgi:octopine/nopaline transport system substrate-binding protein
MSHKLKALFLMGAMILAAQTAMAKDWKTVTIAMEGAYPPWNSTDSSNQIVGFEVDLANDLCARMKVDCKIIAQDWDGIIPGLQAGKFDVISDGMSITDERKKSILFSNPYAATPAAFVAAKDSPLASLAENGKVFDLVKDPAAGDAAIAHLKEALKGKTIGVQVSTTLADFATKNLKDVATVNEYKTIDERDLDLKAGRIDAILDDYPPLADLLEKPDSTELAFVGPKFKGGVFGDGVGYGIRKEDADLLDKFNTALKAAQDDGSVKKYSLKWFKIDTAP